MVKDKIITEITSYDPSLSSDPKLKPLNLLGRKKSPSLQAYLTKQIKSPNLGPKLYPEHSKTFYSRSQPPLGTRFLRRFASKIKIPQSKPRSPERNLITLRESHKKKNIKFNSHDCLTPEICLDTPRKKMIPSNKFLLRDKGLESYRRSMKRERQSIFNRLIASQREHKIINDNNKLGLLKKSNSTTLAMMKNKSIQQDQVLLKEFTNEFALLCAETDFGSTGFFNYSKFCSILNKLKFIEDSFNKSDEERELVLKAWKLLGGNKENKVKVDNLYIFLLGVMNIEVKIEKQPMIPQKFKNRNEILMFSKKDIVKIHQDFMCLYLNRIDRKEIHSIQINDSSSGPEEIISEGETPDIDDAVNNFPENNENHDVAPNVLEKPEILFSMPSSYKLIKRISLRELSSTPKDIITKLNTSVH
ncbi:hypothetical protein SteCoe_25948 [Stentor coeruleus]|uniref:EF-hand domain-containing protein n=1 Tax=Stentor coeruleus TaxID=5963 RepID=A0A1R2BDY6_9CILI|nr:hypothetical protein SteCoe_25948 [Stentor coeruleus]